MAKSKQGSDGLDKGMTDPKEPGGPERKVEVRWMDYCRMRPFDLNFQWVRLAGSRRG